MELGNSLVEENVSFAVDDGVGRDWSDFSIIELKPRVVAAVFGKGYVVTSCETRKRESECVCVRKGVKG